LNFVDPDLTVRTVNYIGTRTCDFGHLQDQQTRLVAVAECCGAITCSAPGCSWTCTDCSRSICRPHAKVYDDGEVCCPRCRPLAFLRRLIIGKRR
jgi:hypothetical protein